MPKIEKYLGNSPAFCDFTPFVLLWWQKLYKTSYAVIDGVMYLKFLVNGQVHFAVCDKTVKDKTDILFSLANSDKVSLSLVSNEALLELSQSGVLFESDCNEDYFDYVYDYDDIASLKGKKYAGQRNHINKFLDSFHELKYEKITHDNIRYVLEFLDSLPNSQKESSESRDFERKMVREYLENFFEFPTLSGIVYGGQKIVAFATGEVLNDILFVHIEKAFRDINGAYPIIVREFARNNPARLINREEDMGDLGLRTSKQSYHPKTLLKKFNVELYR